MQISGYEYGELDESDDRHMKGSVEFLEFFSVQRRTPRESDTASRREEACLLNPCNVVAQWSHHSLLQWTRQ